MVVACLSTLAEDGDDEDGLGLDDTDTKAPYNKLIMPGE